MLCFEKSQSPTPKANFCSRFSQLLKKDPVTTWVLYGLLPHEVFGGRIYFTIHYFLFD